MKRNLFIRGLLLTTLLASTAVSTHAYSNNVIAGSHISILGKGNGAEGDKINIIGKDNGARYTQNGVTTERKVKGNDIAIMGNKNTVTSDHAFVIGSETNVTHANSVALGYLSTDREATDFDKLELEGLTFTSFAGIGNATNGVVTVGSVGKERQIINVAAGEIANSSTDAINGSQLYATNKILANVSKSVKDIFGSNATITADGKLTFTNIGGTGATTIHDAIASNSTSIAKNTEAIQANTNSINTLQQQTNRLGNRISKVGAGAAALAALHPLDFNKDDKWSFSVGYGNYRDANAMTLGAFYRPSTTRAITIATRRNKKIKKLSQH